MFKQLKRIIKSGLVGIALAYNISCGQANNINIPIDSYQNHPPTIISENLETVAGNYFNQIIETSDEDNDKVVVRLESGPEWLSLENNTLKGSPRHSLLGRSQTGNFKIELSAFDGKDRTRKTLDLIVSERNTNFDYLKTNEDIQFICESGCSFNENYLDKKSEGVFNAVKVLKETTQSDTPNSRKPVEYHLDADSKCVANGVYAYILNNEKWNICAWMNKDQNGNGIEINPNFKIEDIENQAQAVHEYVHVIFDNNPMYSYKPGEDGGRKFQEATAVALMRILTSLSGSFKSDSFCDIIPNAQYPKGEFPVLYNLCTVHNFDVKDLPEMFYKLKNINNPEVMNQNCLVQPYNSVINTKRVIDSIVNANTRWQWIKYYQENPNGSILELADEQYDNYCE